MNDWIEGDWHEGRPIVTPEPEPRSEELSPNRARVWVPEGTDEELRAAGHGCVKVHRGG
jgi:hypothetical protein